MDLFGLGELLASLSFHINAAWQRRSVRVVLTVEPMTYLCIDLRWKEADEVDLLPSLCVCERLCATLVFCPSLLHCISIKRHMLPLVIAALPDYCIYRGGTRKGYFLFRGHQFPLHAWRWRLHLEATHTHMHTELIDLLWRVRKVPALHFSKMDPFGGLTLQPLRPILLLSPTSSQGSAHPAGVPTHSAESGVTPNTCFCHKLRVSFLLLFSFNTSRKKWGENGSF